MMRLIIAEKPSVARAIADVLGHARGRDGFIECGGWTVTWCAGHLLEQAPPEDYHGGNFVQARDLPVLPEAWLLHPKDPRAKKQLNVIKGLLKAADEVVHGGDADREGQLLVDEVLHHLNWRGKTSRLWLSSLDEASVRRALSALKPNEALKSLHDSALARQRADWLLGLNGSMAISRNLQARGLSGSWSVGRVQTPTLALIVDRHAAIHGHRKRDHYKVQITLQDGVTAWWQIPDDLLTDGLQLDKARADQAAAAVEGRAGSVARYGKRQGQRAAPLPYSLAALQMEANSRFGLSAKQTLEAAQALYEAKVATYPRTDCRYLPEEMRGEAAVILDKIGASAPGIDVRRQHPAWNTGEVTAHHAIIPTGQALPVSLDERAAKVYGIIRESYIRLFMPDERFEQQEAVFEFKSDPAALIFRAQAKKVLEPGWTALGQDIGEDAETGETAGKALPDYREGQPVACAKAAVQALQTRPPQPFNDKTLIAAMTGIHKLVTDPKQRARLRETSGLGTEATRAGIIETLFVRGYAERRGKNIEPTPRGSELIAMLRKACPALTDPGETALQEDALADIISQKLSFERFLQTVAAKAREEVQALLGATLIKGEITMHECPKCHQAALAPHTAKSGLAYWKCGQCQTAFGDDNGSPGKEWFTKDAAPAQNGDGPPCPQCRQKTAQSLTRNGKTYYRCRPCHRDWWPDKEDEAKLGREWEIRK